MTSLLGKEQRMPQVPSPSSQLSPPRVEMLSHSPLSLEGFKHAQMTLWFESAWGSGASPALSETWSREEIKHSWPLCCLCLYFRPAWMPVIKYFQLSTSKSRIQGCLGPPTPCSGLFGCFLKRATSSEFVATPFYGHSSGYVCTKHYFPFQKKILIHKEVILGKQGYDVFDKLR